MSYVPWQLGARYINAVKIGGERTYGKKPESVGFLDPRETYRESFRPMWLGSSDPAREPSRSCPSTPAARLAKPKFWQPRAVPTTMLSPEIVPVDSFQFGKCLRCPRPVPSSSDLTQFLHHLAITSGRAAASALARRHANRLDGIQGLHSLSISNSCQPRALAAHISTSAEQNRRASQALIPILGADDQDRPSGRTSASSSSTNRWASASSSLSRLEWRSEISNFSPASASRSYSAVASNPPSAARFRRSL